MKINGTHTIDNTTAEQVWSFIMNPDVLAKITPGLKQLDPVGDDEFKAISEIKIGPVKASFEGDLALTNKVEQKSTTVVVKQDSKIGNVQASIGMEIITGDNNVTVNYDGEAKMVGKIATMGQRMVGSVVTSLSKQFFKNLENEINNTNNP